VEQRAHHVLLVSAVLVRERRGLERVGQPVDREPAVTTGEQLQVLEHTVG
jgi:F420-dependent methylenetetrahydromethanopterin dehydrogenase